MRGRASGSSCEEASGSGCTDVHGMHPESTPLERLVQSGGRLTAAAHLAWGQVRPGDVVVDATCGNGLDTVFMCGRVGAGGEVYAFDTNAAAIAATRLAVDSSIPAGERPVVHYCHASHTTMQQVVGSNRAALVAFNLGEWQWGLVS